MKLQASLIKLKMISTEISTDTSAAEKKMLRMIDSLRKRVRGPASASVVSVLEGWPTTSDKDMSVINENLVVEVGVTRMRLDDGWRKAAGLYRGDVQPHRFLGWLVDD